MGSLDALLARYREARYLNYNQTTDAGVLDIIDFLCFQNAFIAGCP